MNTATKIKTTSGDDRENGGVYEQIVRDLQEASLTQDEVAAVVQTNIRSVQNWAGGRTKPRADARDRLLELHYIVRKLREFLTPDGVEVWLHSRNSWLDDRKPVDILAEGHFDEVLRVIAQISNGEY